MNLSVIESLTSTHTNWDVTTEGIYFVDHDPASESRWSLNFLGFSDRRVTQVTHLEHAPFLAGPAPSVSQERRWILSAQDESGSDRMFVEDYG